MPSFIYRLEDAENSATCPEIGMKIPKIVLNTFKGKGRIKETCICIEPFPNTHSVLESLNNTKKFLKQSFRYQKYNISCGHVAFRVHK